jgi:hypothetical protein
MVARVREFAKCCEDAGDWANDKLQTKRCFWILSERIFDSSVEGGIPSLAAAPNAPDTRPLLSARASSMIFFSCDSSFWESGYVAWNAGIASRDSQLSSTEKFSVWHKMTDR